MTLEELVRARLLHKEPARSGEVQQLVNAARRGLGDSGVETVSTESRFSIAYHAALQLCNAGLRLHGYRTGAEMKGPHVTAIRSLEHTLGIDARTRRVLDAFRRKRHKAQYEGMDVVSETELNELRAIVERLLREVERRLAAA
jgi:hypothetical protein